jgi:alpha-galactosidase
VDLGLAALGYTRVTPDCGWPANKRKSDGTITWNTTLFPSGYPALGDYIHSLGLKFGLYSGAGVYQCGSNSGNQALPASLGEHRVCNRFKDTNE